MWTNSRPQAAPAQKVGNAVTALLCALLECALDVPSSSVLLAASSPVSILRSIPGDTLCKQGGVSDANGSALYAEVVCSAAANCCVKCFTATSSEHQLGCSLRKHEAWIELQFHRKQILHNRWSCYMQVLQARQICKLLTTCRCDAPHGHGRSRRRRLIRKNTKTNTPA